MHLCLYVIFHSVICQNGIYQIYKLFREFLDVVREWAGRVKRDCIGGAFCKAKYEIRRRRKARAGKNSFPPTPFLFARPSVQVLRAKRAIIQSFRKKMFGLRPKNTANFHFERQGFSFGGVFWTMFELSLNKIQNNDVRFRPPPLRFGGTKTEKFSLHFLILSRVIFSFKRKRKFFCFVFLLIREKRKRSILIRKRAKIPSPRPPSFLPFCFSASPDLRPFFRQFYFLCQLRWRATFNCYLISNEKNCLNLR